MACDVARLSASSEVTLFICSGGALCECDLAEETPACLRECTLHQPGVSVEGGALAMTSLVLEVRHVNATLLGVNASYAETCRAVTQCLLKPLKAAVETETCSDLVRRETFAYRTTMDFADDVRVEVRGVSVARDALLGAAAKAGLVRAMLRNRAGKAVAASSAALAAATTQADWAHAPGMVVNLLDLPGDESWPIVIATYALVPKEPKHPEALRAFIRFIINEPTAAPSVFAASMPPAVRTAALAMPGISGS